MSEKNFKITPKVWPKEYTFEEFKMLNPNINENILINYYNKYLQEYAEDRSRHLKHFNNTKEDLSKEIKLLKEVINPTSDGDENVGPTGAGRRYRSPLNHNKNSLHFDGIDDVVGIDIIQEGILPGDGTLKPYKGLTVSAWVNTSYIGSTIASATPAYIIAAAQDSQTGWLLYHSNRRFWFINSHDKGNPAAFGVSPARVDVSTVWNSILDVKSVNGGDPLYHFREDGWHHVVGTWDGKTQLLYLDGEEANARNTKANPIFDQTLHKWDMFAGNSSYGNFQQYGVEEDDYGTTKGSAGSIHYSLDTGNYSEGAGLVNVAIGRRADASQGPSGNGSFLGYAGGAWSGSMAEVAVWDAALDATTINELWHNGISGSAPKFDLSYPGYNNGENNHNHPYDTHDEGLNYTNVGKYAGSLQGWWRLEEGTGITTQDSSGKNRDGELVNSPTWSGSYTPGPY